MRRELRLALEAVDQGPLDRVIQQGNPDDLEALRAAIGASGATSTLRRRVLYALGRWPGEADARVAAIESVLPRLNAVERAGAINALGRIGVESALNALIPYIDDPVPDVRRQAVKSLHRFGTLRATDALRDLASREPQASIRALAEGLLRQG